MSSVLAVLKHLPICELLFQARKFLQATACCELHDFLQYTKKLLAAKITAFCFLGACVQGVLNGVMAVMNWFSDICSWKSPVTTVLVHILLLILVWYPELLLPTMFLYMFLIGAWNYRFRSRTPPFMDAKLSQGEHIGDLDELEEEFNVVPASRAQEVSSKLHTPHHL